MKRFKKILCVLEAGQSGKTVLESAVSLAEKNQARLTVIEVTEDVSTGVEMPEEGTVSIDLQGAMVSTREQELAMLIAPYNTRIEIKTKVLTGTPFLEIIREVLRSGHDLVIKAPETQDWMDRLFGSDDMHLLRKCPCPVWMIKPQAINTYHCILAAVDVSDAYPPNELESRHILNQKILEIASSLTLLNGAEFHVGHAWEAPAEHIMRGAFMNVSEEKVVAYVEQVRQKHESSLNTLLSEVISCLESERLNSLKPKTHLVKGFARKQVPTLAKQIKADLVVMGTVSRTSISGFIMGNTAETILNQLDCSVLAIKPPGFITPVTLED